MRSIRAPIATSLVGLALAAPAADAAPGSVDIQHSAFNPSSVTIDSGESVEWTNLDGIQHTVDFAGFTSGFLAEGDTYLRVFDDPGEFDYICGLHPSMTGTVVAQAVPGAPTATATATPPSALRGRPITFDGGGSTAAAGDTLALWSWDFGGGATDSGESVQHAFNRAGTHEVVLTVEDDDGQTDRTRLSVVVRLPTLRIADASVTEGNRGTKSLSFTLRLSAPVSYPVTVSFRTREGTAKAPGDFAARSGTLTFEPGATRRTVAVSVKGDRKSEPNERLTLVLSAPRGTRIADGTAVGTIRNDD